MFIRPLHETPFKDAYFDFILSTEVFEHVPVADVDRSMKEMYRVAKPGAKVRAPPSHPPPVYVYKARSTRICPAGGTTAHTVY